MTELLAFRLPHEERERLRAAATREATSVSQIVREAIAAKLGASPADDRARPEARSS
jgi:predicted DNA-binding protein